MMVMNEVSKKEISKKYPGIRKECLDVVQWCKKDYTADTILAGRIIALNSNKGNVYETDHTEDGISLSDLIINYGAKTVFVFTEGDYILEIIEAGKDAVLWDAKETTLSELNK